MSNMSVELYNKIREDALATDITLCGRQYTTRNVYPVEEPTTRFIMLDTLTGLVNYLKTNVDNLNFKKLICHVESPIMVTLFSGLYGDFKQRDEYVQVMVKKDPFPFGKFLGAEEFNIKMQTCFYDSELKATDKGLVLKYVGNVRSEVVAGVGDDGVSQEMTIRTGIASVENVLLPNPVILRPFRTFNEVEQPASSFIFRARTGAEFALFEADNGVWEREAMKNIKDFLEFELPELHVIA